MQTAFACVKKQKCKVHALVFWPTRPVARMAVAFFVGLATRLKTCPPMEDSHNRYRVQRPVLLAHYSPLAARILTSEHQRQVWAFPVSKSLAFLESALATPLVSIVGVVLAV